MCQLVLVLLVAALCHCRLAVPWRCLLVVLAAVCLLSVVAMCHWRHHPLLLVARVGLCRWAVGRPCLVARVGLCLWAVVRRLQVRAVP